MSEVVRTTSQLPADYKPEEGVKRIAIAKAAAEMFEKAKDADGLRNALFAKLEEQRNFVLWWDAQEKDPGGGDRKSADYKAKITLNTSVKGDST